MNKHSVNKSVAILQSSYIPWKGYFDLINSVDEFVIYDDMQFTRRDWRNRNRIKTESGLIWLTIPVEVKGKFGQKIKDTKIAGNIWPIKHWKSICHAHGKSPYFKDYRDMFEDLYLHKATKLNYLSDVNYLFMQNIMRLLGIQTKLLKSSDFNLQDGKTERLLGICKDLNATEYLSGPSAKVYLDERTMMDQKISVKWMDYSGYPNYEQLHGEFEHSVTILDLIFQVGIEAKKYMNSFGNNL